MNPDDRDLALRELDYLLHDGVVAGLRFDWLQLLIDHREPSMGTVSIQLESRFSVYAQRPHTFPSTEGDLPDIGPDEELRLLCSIGGQSITSIELGPIAPHLILTMKDGSILFVNGAHDTYETWHVRCGIDPNSWLIVACPGDSIAVWSPASTKVNSGG